MSRGGQLGQLHQQREEKEEEEQQEGEVWVLSIHPTARLASVQRLRVTTITRCIFSILYS